VSSKAPLTECLPAWAAGVHTLSRAFGVAAAIMIVMSIAVICQMVFIRAVLDQSSIWQTEFVTFLILSATFLGSPYIMLTGGHVAVDLLPLMVRSSTRRKLYLAGHTVALLFCGFFFYASVPWWLEAWHSGQTTASLWKARLWIPYLAVPVGLFLLCLQMATDMILVALQRQLPFGLQPEEGL
jgi:TRAP-type C4-dicarboxylate transport system permease small subunit